MYEGIQTEVISTTRFEQNLDLSTSYLGRINIMKVSRIKAEEMFPISEQCYSEGRLLAGTECQILLDTGASKSFILKSHYLHC